MEITNQDWFQQLVEECDAIMTEAVHNSRWELIVGYHHLGKRILEDIDKDRDLVQRVAKTIGKSERTIYQAVQFAKKFPDVDALPQGKNISWHKITNELLPEPKEKKEESRPVCPTCLRPL